MDEIFIKGLEVSACHGCNPEEKITPQKFVISAVLGLDFSGAAKTDDVTETAHYGHIMRLISGYCANNCFNLIEKLADGLAREILLFCENGKAPLVRSVRLTVEKPQAPVAYPFETLGVTVERARHTVALSLGCNLGDRRATLKNAVERLAEDRCVRLVSTSSVMETAPFECSLVQPDYMNLAVLLETVYSPVELLDFTESVEREFGRSEKGQRAARTLDVDIVCFDNLVLDTPRLTLPHADMHRREFVLKPLAEIYSCWRHPVLGKTVRQLLSEL